MSQIPSAARRVRKVALEEHFIVPSLMPYLERDFPAVPPEAKRHIIGLLSDFGEARLAAMDDGGIDVAVLSITGPGVQAEPDAATATRLAAGANDALAEEIARRPDRYAGFAHLAMQDPEGAADELERCVRELGFRGAMVNHHTLGVYLDDPANEVFWERLAALGVPLYLHPGDAFARPHVLGGVPELDQPMWEWTTETASHALRLVLTGVFERHPGAQLILGHAGETLPYMLWRLDSRYTFIATERRLKQPPSHYLLNNVSVTLSGQFDAVPLQAALAALGTERVLFSVDYPYESPAEAADFMDTTPLPDDVRAAVADGNARRLLRL